MAEKILFVNQRQEDVQEFSAAMRQMNYRVDVAEDGLTAVEKLETSEYAVMITDTVLKGMDGEKLIAHCNKNYPTTICIVYATKLSVGQLGFLSNQLDVFRIFLRPVDVSGKLQQTLARLKQETA